MCHELHCGQYKFLQISLLEFPALNNSIIAVRLSKKRVMTILLFLKV